MFYLVYHVNFYNQIGFSSDKMLLGFDLNILIYVSKTDQDRCTWKYILGAMYQGKLLINNY